jgi:hypothetical protein
VDGDFLIPQRFRGHDNHAAVYDIVKSYMQKCRWLLVPCGTTFAAHPWETARSYGEQQLLPAITDKWPIREVDML